jgi:creatinine deaminase
MPLSDDDRRGLAAAIEEARAGRAEGGIPIGSALMIDGAIAGRGHNRRVQQGSVVLHAEMDCLERAGRLPASAYARATLYTTLSPCDMCTGAALLYGIPRVVVGEHESFLGGEALLAERGVEVVVADDPDCIALMREFVVAEPELWHEDIGEEGS